MDTDESLAGENQVTSNRIIWQPDAARIRSSAMYAFMHQQGFDNYVALHNWSIENSPEFWLALRDYCEIGFDREADTVLTRPENIMDAGWFDGAQLNFAKHLLRHCGDQAAIIFCGEDGARRELSRDELRASVAAVAASLRAAGVVKGDRVAGYLPNCPEAIIAMLAAASIGAVWSSCSPDFGVTGVLDRFGQIEPKILFATNAYHYNGKVCDTRQVVEGVANELPTLLHTVIVPFVESAATETSLDNAVQWQDFVSAEAQLEFVAVDFNHPLYVMFSSGTTGVPKCIVHGHGGTLLQQTKEHVLHTGVTDGDRLFYFTTCGWMMWNWLVCGLGTGATLILFDGGAVFPRWSNSVGDRGARAYFHFRYQREVYIRAGEYSRQARARLLTTGPARDSFDGVATGPGEFRLRIRCNRR